MTTANTTYFFNQSLR